MSNQTPSTIFAEPVGRWRRAHWQTRADAVLQVRLREDGDVDVRYLLPDEFGRERWSEAEKCPAAYWRAEGCTACAS